LTEVGKNNGHSALEEKSAPLTSPANAVTSSEPVVTSSASPNDGSEKSSAEKGERQKFCLSSLFFHNTFALALKRFSNFI
jgi:hypothetical protein